MGFTGHQGHLCDSIALKCALAHRRLCQAFLYFTGRHVNSVPVKKHLLLIGDLP